jgi:hypothetical protein
MLSTALLINNRQREAQVFQLKDFEQVESFILIDSSKATILVLNNPQNDSSPILKMLVIDPSNSPSKSPHDKQQRLKFPC